MRGDGRIFLRGRIWWIAYCAPGARGRVHEERESSKSTSEAVARKLLAKRIRAVANHRDGVRAFAGPKAERLTVGDLLDDLKDDYERRAIKSLRTALARIELLREVLGEMKANALGPDDVTRYERLRMNEDHVSGATVNRETAILTTAYKLAMKKERLARRPYIPKQRESGPRTGFFEADQHAAILAKLSPRIADMARVAYICGWRADEIRSLRWENIDRNAREMSIPDSKNGQGRVFPLDDELWAIFARWWEARTFRRRGVEAISEYVFHRRGRPMSESQFGRLWTRARKASGVDRIFHDYRRTAVRNLVRAGVPESVAMSITGHRSDSIFRRYNITSTADRAAAVARVREYLSGGGNVAQLRHDSDKYSDSRRRRSRK